MIDPGATRRPTWPETLPPAVEDELSAIGAWDAFLALDPIRSPGRVSAWGGSELAWQDACFSSVGGGWLVDRHSFDAMLRGVAMSAGVELHARARVVSLEPSERGWYVVNRNIEGRTSRTEVSFTVDATGRAAFVARHQGAVRRRLDRLVAAGVSVPVAATAPGHTLVEAVEEGWWWAAPLPGRAAAITFVDPPLVANSAHPDYWWRAFHRTDHVAGYLGGLGAIPPNVAVSVRPAGSHILAPVSGPGWLAAGDAATSWDPLASAGLLHALRSGVQAGKAVDALLRLGSTARIGAYAHLTRSQYERYLCERAAMYGLERRWPAARFWRHRATSPRPGVDVIAAG
jgi:flavin-dependent dehydrogenase